MGVLDYFSKGIQIQLFYALAITLLVYSMPATDRNFVAQFESSPANVDLETTANEFQNSFQSQANFGIVDVAAFALFSGNSIVDLMLNFFTAIPSMVTLLLKAIFMFVAIDATAQKTIMLYVYAIIAILYVIALLNFLINVRSQTQGVL